VNRLTVPAARPAVTARVAALLAATLAMIAFPAAAAAKQKKWFGAVVPDIPTGSHLHQAPRARIANLPYGGGPVMHSNRTHLIFWQPTGSGLSYDPGYQAQVETFLRNVAADSRRPTNVYGLSGQYHDSRGPAVYSSRYAGQVVATDALPQNDCAEPAQTGPGWSVCLSDSLLETEIQHVVAANHLPKGGREIYFLVMPNGMGTCETSGPDNCALGGSGTGFCGYHSSTPDDQILYAVIPYNAISGHCQSGNPRPNSSTADPVLSTLSHEHNEVVTDPLGDAWIDGAGNENGDLCIRNYGPALGGSGAAAWNEVIHGGHYFLQEEWSNEDASCQPRDEADAVSFAAQGSFPARTAAAFTGHATDPDGTIVSYDWFFGDGGRAHRRVASHRYARAGTYKVILRTTDSAGNWAFASRIVRVTQGHSKDSGHRHRHRK
jgi:PKD domain